MPVLCRNARPFIVYPFVYPKDYVAQITLSDDDVSPAPKVHPHAIHIALEWRRCLRTEPNLTMAELARRQGVSRARVTQIMNLLRLPQPIVRELQSITSEKQAQRVSKRVLRRIARLESPADQLKAFRNLQAPPAKPPRLDQKDAALVMSRHRNP